MTKWSSNATTQVSVFQLDTSVMAPMNAETGLMNLTAVGLSDFLLLARRSLHYVSKKRLNFKTV